MSDDRAMFKISAEDLSVIFRCSQFREIAKREGFDPATVKVLYCAADPAGSQNLHVSAEIVPGSQTPHYIGWFERPNGFYWRIVAVSGRVMSSGGPLETQDQAIEEGRRASREMCGVEIPTVPIDAAKISGTMKTTLEAMSIFGAKR